MPFCCTGCAMMLLDSYCLVTGSFTSGLDICLWLFHLTRRGFKITKRWLLNFYVDDYIHSCGKLMIFVWLFSEDDFDWHPLRDFYEVTACVIWRQ